MISHGAAPTNKDTYVYSKHGPVRTLKWKVRQVNSYHYLEFSKSAYKNVSSQHHDVEHVHYLEIAGEEGSLPTPELSERHCSVAINVHNLEGTRLITPTYCGISWYDNLLVLQW